MSYEGQFITINDIISLFGISAPNGNAQINAINVPQLFAQDINVSRNLIVNGVPIVGGAGTFLDGTSLLPGMAFSNQTSTGFYRSGSSIGASTTGNSKLIISDTFGLQMQSPISTVSGDLILNPAGSNVDFSGKNLVNVGGIVTNPNRYEVVAPATVITTTSSATVLYSIPTTSNSVYTIVSDFTFANSSNNTDSGGRMISCKAKNVGGTVTVSGAMEINSVLDASLIGIDIVLQASGTNVNVMVTGLPGVTIKWFGASVITKQVF